MFSIENNRLISDEPGFSPRPFLDKSILTDPKQTLYVYVEITKEGINQGLHLKFGKAVGCTVWDRYANVTGSTQMNRMIAVWASDKGDEGGHSILRFKSKYGRGYVWDGSKEISPLNTEESYYIPNMEAFNRFFEDIQEYVEIKPITKNPAPPLWKEIDDVVNEVLSF